MSLTCYVYMSRMGDKSLTSTHHSERVMDNQIDVWMAIKLVLDIYVCKVSKTIEFGHVSTRKKSPTHNYCPSHRYYPCIFDMRHFYVLHSKHMLNILVFKKLDGFEQPWSSAIQNRAQKFREINFRWSSSRPKLTTLS